MNDEPQVAGIDDPLNDGVELLEVAKNPTGYSKLEAVDRVKVRIDSLNQERAERVARRREPDSTLKRLLHRIIPYGGIISSGCNLASSSLGAGILALPYAFNKSGLAMALVYLVVIGILTVYSFTLLGIVGKRTGLRNYEQITKSLMGTGADYFLALNMWLISFGAEVSYVISMGDIIGAFINSSPDAPAYLKTLSGRRLLTSAVWIVLMLPLCLPKEINSLRHISVIGVLLVIFFGICMVIHSARNGLAHGIRDDLVYFQTGNQAIQGLSIFTFAFLCQLNAYEVYGEMYKPSVARFTKSAGLGVFLCFSLYFCSGLFGYLEFGPALTGTVLERYNPIADKMMGVAYAGLILKLCVGYGLHMIPVRDAVYHVIHVDVKTIEWWRNSLVCGSMATLSLIAGLLIPSITIVFGLVGGFSGGFIGFIFPALLYMYSGNWTLQSVGYLHYFGTYLLLLVGVIGVVFGTTFAVYGEIIA
ncbi:putative amino acid permease [Trypanosoma conorhini]|uniref:Putative amino acid permease n=1 Tax=Trypanosoma conorhini TaxID=83891 RepID=A0A3R7N6V6_9TRYP|nr:putative amino acid permease [Trypanosoma conorhini]RNF26386.1 putative amino acid permease [Trypanosoma conorhini]